MRLYKTFSGQWCFKLHTIKQRKHNMTKKILINNTLYCKWFITKTVGRETPNDDGRVCGVEEMSGGNSKGNASSLDIVIYRGACRGFTPVESLYSSATSFCPVNVAAKINLSSIKFYHFHALSEVYLKSH